MDRKEQPSSALLDLINKYNDRKMLWTHIDSFNTNYELWFKSPFTNFNSEDIEKEMKKYENGIL